MKTALRIATLAAIINAILFPFILFNYSFWLDVAITAAEVIFLSGIFLIARKEKLPALRNTTGIIMALSVINIALSAYLPTLNDIANMSVFTIIAATYLIYYLNLSHLEHKFRPAHLASVIGSVSSVLLLVIPLSTLVLNFLSESIVETLPLLPVLIIGTFTTAFFLGFLGMTIALIAQVFLLHQAAKKYKK